jgi:hypothetical protein
LLSEKAAKVFQDAHRSGYITAFSISMWVKRRQSADDPAITIKRRRKEK